jgi:hypothetical protein
MNVNEMHRCYAKNEDRICANDEVNVNEVKIRYGFRIVDDEVDYYVDDYVHSGRVDQYSEMDLDHEFEDDLTDDILDDYEHDKDSLDVLDDDQHELYEVDYKDSLEML